MKYFIPVLFCILLAQNLPAAEPLDIDSQRQLFLDDFIVESMDGLTRTLHQPVKRGPVLKAEEPWEGVYIGVFSPPMWVPDEGVFQQVYECRYDKRGQSHCYALATSKDGVHWEKPIAALLKDLKARGMLADTLVVFATEFGRTPAAQGTDGRDHHPHAFSIWLAGGGIRGGMTFGQTDEFGYYVTENKVTIPDFHATILHLLGLDHEQLTYRYGGRDHRLTDVHGHVLKEILA